MSKRVIQHGVQVVWADPKAAGVMLKDGEDYEATWQWFDTPKQATKFIEHYIYDIGRDPKFGGVAEINRGSRWAVEEYGPVVVASSIKEPCHCECHVWPDKVAHVNSCCTVMEARES